MEKSDVESEQKIKVNRRGGEVIFNIESHLHYQPKELCKKLYKGNFYLCSDGEKKTIIDKRMLSLSNKLENRIKNPRQRYRKEAFKETETKEEQEG